MTSFVQSESNLRLSWQVGLETDIGGGRENQDDCFVWIKRDDNVIVLCVLDGHGREVGKIASESAKQCLFKHLDENYASLLQNPAEFLIHAHDVAHEHIRNRFRSELTRQGYEIVTTEQGFLMKRKQAADNWACVHGGTSCSLVALVRDQLYIANVGDSTGILCSSFGVLAGADLGYMLDAAVPAELNRQAVPPHAVATSTSTTSASVPAGSSKHFGASSECNTSDVNEAGNSSSGADARACPSSSGATCSGGSGPGCGASTLVVTAEHSPECPYEYARLLRFRKREGNAQLPALVVVYDSSSCDKTRCAPVFERDAAGTPQVTNKGSYYKNVRREWASLVSTPPTAQFQDALAFTRSLGDLHLHTYGVTHLPEVQHIDLQAVFRRLQNHCATLPALSSSEDIVTAPDGGTSSSNNSSSTGGAEIINQSLSAEAVARSTLCLVLATDGVWDNWTYEDVGRFVMDASCLGAVGAGVDGAKRVTISFMQRNALYAKRNFGASADNATGIVLYISAAPDFPAV